LNVNDDTRRVFHFVYDADNADPQQRLRLYVNGVDQGPGQVAIGSTPALGEGLDLSQSDLELQFMNQAPTPSRGMLGTVFHYAVFETVLTDYEIAANAAALLVSDDGPP
jgi:hypothetical protein